MAGDSKQSIITKNRIQPLESEQDDSAKNYKSPQQSKFKEENEQKKSDENLNNLNTKKNAEKDS